MPGRAIHDRHAADIGQHHAVGEMRDRFVRIADGERTVRQQIEQRVIVVGFFLFRTPAQHVGPSDQAGDAAVGVDQRIGFVPPRIAGEERKRLAQRHRRWQRVDLADHHVVDAQQLERVDAVFAHHMLAAPGDLLGQDRPLEQQHGQRVGGAGRDQQRAHQREVTGQFDREKDGGQRRAHGAAHHRRHADKRPYAMIARQPQAFQPACAAAEDQERRQHAAGGAGCECDDPDRRFHH